MKESDGRWRGALREKTEKGDRDRVGVGLQSTPSAEPELIHRGKF